ncbi:hypothetical protein KSC_105300 [Ktedonobacter sp. SOSP1-52]|nr:hypothetical protein KSC_105300 [Ktedonobacter sp. SOSP1-52]
MTELRLFHKRAAREAPAGSMEGNQHDGTQAAMKTVINAAYGYLGATSMALFADLEAANEVTRRGRALLDSLLASLRERGMVPIEADTDGVYFAVPSEWGEEQERALVSQVGATLPDGVKLEYEARYGAMLSHAIKNYALLTYSGEVIVRGAAMRSSRSEPYGERFLRQALRCVMQGDLVGVAQGYQDTLRALRTRSLPASDVATRFRLSKDAQTYLAGRARQKEAQYEALLLAGRRQWKSGEHVRFYRASTGTPVWLPDDIDDISPLEDAEEDSGETMRVAPPSSALGRSPDLPAYDSDYYQQVLLNSYAERLRVALEPEDFLQLFRLDAQTSFFDRPVEQMHVRWIRYASEVSGVEEQG